MPWKNQTHGSMAARRRGRGSRLLVAGLTAALAATVAGSTRLRRARTHPAVIVTGKTDTYVAAWDAMGARGLRRLRTQPC